MTDRASDPATPAVELSELREALHRDKAYLAQVRTASTNQLRTGVTARMTSDITGNPAAARNFNQFKIEEERALLRINDQPFFARVDSAVTTGSTGSEPLTLLLTTARMNCAVSGDAWELVSWTNPLSQRLLDKRPGEKEEYVSPRRRSRTTYEVGPSARYEGEIAPVAKRASFQLWSGSAYVLDEQEFLSRGIEEPPHAPAPREYEPTPAFGLGDIIVTADEPQRVAMLLPFADSVLIEGPPGSGKTSIGIMRIACLVDQQWDELGLQKGVDRPFHDYQWMRVLVFTEEMVEYLRQLVASIGVERVPVQTTKKFMQEICRAAGTLTGRELIDPISATAVKGQRETLAAYWAGFQIHLAKLWLAQHEAFVLALETVAPEAADVGKIISDWVARVRSAELQGDALSGSVNLSVPIDRWVRARRSGVPDLEEVPPMPSANMAKAQAEMRVRDRARVMSQNDLARAQRQDTERVIKDVEKIVRSFVQLAVAREDIVLAMFESPQFATVVEAAKASGTSQERVEAGVRQWRRQYEVSNPGYSEYDLAAATWLGNQILLAPDTGEKPLVGGTRPRITHLVIDEVQDLSPCHIATLRSLMDPKGTMTVVGDLRQNLHPAGGLLRWEELGLDHLKRCVFGVNYRQTRELGEFVQELHGSLFGTAAAWQTSSILTGPTPRLGKTRSWRSAAVAVAEEIRHWRNVTPKATVAVLYDTDLEPKDLDQLQERLADALQDQILTVHAVNPAARGSQLRESDCVLIASVKQTKGLEFDAVIVVDLRDDWAEPSEEVDPRLRNGLYVAASRARNCLTLCMRVVPDWMEAITSHGLIERVEWKVAGPDMEE